MSALDIRDLTIMCGEKTLLNRICLSIPRGEMHGLIGPSGSGKSLIAKAVVQLLPKNLTMSGSILLSGRPFHPSMRGKEVGLIFQDPASALNPTLSIGEQIADGIREHHPHLDAKREALLWMQRLEIPEAHKRYHYYPYQMSGGQLQRAHTASLLALKPSLLIADEITTALDPTTAVQILHLLSRIIQEEQLTLLWISHDKKTLRTDKITCLSSNP